MIEIWPHFESHPACVQCSSDAVRLDTLLFQGKHVLGVYKCNQCHTAFYSTLPSGHDLLFPTAFSIDNKVAKFSLSSDVWLSMPLIRSIIKPVVHEAVINRTVFNVYETVILLNCLDSCFGHVFTKLWNVERLLQRHPDKGLVVIIPRQCRWLIPEGVAEIWEVDAALKFFDNWITSLNSFVHQHLKNYKQVFLSAAYTHLDDQSIQLKKYLKAKRFELENYSSQKPTITFVLREDRFWYRSKVFEWLYFTSIKFKWISILKPILTYHQLRLVKRTIRKLKATIPCHIKITGIGKTGTFNSGIEDLRVIHITNETEHRWNKAFSDSHIVIGIHGSNMLIPTALAAGFINIVPRYKIRHITEDTLSPLTGRLRSFLCRYVDQYSTPEIIALHVISMIQDFAYVYRNLHEPEE